MKKVLTLGTCFVQFLKSSFFLFSAHGDVSNIPFITGIPVCTLFASIVLLKFSILLNNT